MVLLDIVKKAIKHVKYKVEKIKHDRLWKKKNTNNFTTAELGVRIDNVKIGNYTYGHINVHHGSRSDSCVRIGNFCSIASDVIFELGGEHYLSHISSFPFKYMCLGQEEDLSKGNIIVEDDVWIGTRALILSGVTIGQGAVVAAGAVVTKNVPPYAIVGGTPAKVIRYRFSEAIINSLLQVDFSKLTREKIVDNIDKLYNDVNIADDVNWMPQKEIKK